MISLNFDADKIIMFMVLGWLLMDSIMIRRALNRIEKCTNCKASQVPDADKSEAIESMQKISDCNRKLQELVEQDPVLSELIVPKDKRERLLFDIDAVKRYLHVEELDDPADEPVLEKVLHHAIMEEHINQSNPIIKVFEERTAAKKKLEAFARKHSL